MDYLDKKACLIILYNSMCSYLNNKNYNLKNIINKELHKYCLNLDKKDKISIEKQMNWIFQDHIIKKICKENDFIYDKEKIIKPYYYDWFKRVDNTNQINSFIGFLINKLMDDFFGKTFCGLSNENFQLNVNDKVNCIDLEMNYIVLKRLDFKQCLIENIKNKNQIVVFCNSLIHLKDES